MSFLDIFKSRQGKSRELDNLPSMRRARRAVKFDQMSKHVSNLRAVGRPADAEKAANEYLEELFQEWLKDVNDWHPVRLICLAAMRCGALEKGRDYLQKVIQLDESARALDLTNVYFDLGRIYHRLHGSCEKEFRCYEMAVEAVSPVNCNSPATRKEKAKIHHFAFSCTWADQHVGSKEKKRYHDLKRRELAPEIDFDDFKQVMVWLQE